MAKRARSKKYVKRVIKRRRVYGLGRFNRRPRRRLTSRSVPSGMPSQRVAKLRYCSVHDITCTTGVIQEYIYRANGCFDPNQTAVGHQPMGFDQWALLFNHYAVLGSKITVKVLNDNTTTSPAIVGVYLSDGKSMSYTTATEFMEAKKGQYRMISPGQSKSISLVNKFSAKRFFNVTNVNDNQERLGAAPTADPTEQAYFHIWYQTLDSNTDKIECAVTIEYIVQWGEPKELAQS